MTAGSRARKAARWNSELKTTWPAAQTLVTSRQSSSAPADPPDGTG